MVLNERKDRNKFFQIDFSYTETEGFVPNEQMIEVSKTYVPTEKPQFSLEEVEAYALKKKEAAMKKATEYYSKGNAKPGSIAAKANMVKQYNEKNNK